jgi:hypothetical protein
MRDIQSGTGGRRYHRFYARHSIENCRTIAIQGLDDEAKPSGRWLLADILNVCKGGLALIASERQSLAVGQWVLMDLRSHPGFGQRRMQAQVRWLTEGHFALTCGVGFVTPLEVVPVLSVERRSMRRDPNQEEWSLQEERELASS